jgi:tetratricopeptide (TPR) repeat protein/Zn-dependent protease
MSGLMLAIAVLLGWIATVCLHEFGHAIVAYYGGDVTVKDKGYLTLNPLKYTDVGYSLVMPVVFLVMGGVALPGAAVYINTTLLRNRAWKSAVSAAGPLATALVAIALSIPFQLGWATDGWGWNALALLTTYQVAGLFFNLLPVPSFDGFGIIEPWLPQSIQHTTRRWGRYSYLVLLALFWTVPAFSITFWGLVHTVSEGLGVSQLMMQEAYGEFQSSSKGVFVVLLVVALIYRKVVKPPEKAPDQQKDLESTLAAYDRLINAQQATSKIWFHRGQTLSSMGRFEPAIASYDAALKDSNSGAEVWFSRAIVLHQLGRYSEALADYEQTLVLEPNHSYAWANKARILAGLQQSKAAVQAYDQSLKFQPRNAPCWYERGIVLRDLDQVDEALNSFEHALKYERNNAALWIDHAELLCEVGQPEKALISYHNASRHDPENIAVWRSQGNLYLQLNRAQEALRSYSAALTHNPQDSATLLLRGLTLYELGRLPLAVKDFETIQSLLTEELNQPPQQSEVLRNLSPALKTVVQRFTDFLTTPASSTAIAIAQGLLLAILQRPSEALALYDRTLPKELQSPEIQYLRIWVQESLEGR